MHKFYHYPHDVDDDFDDDDDDDDDGHDDGAAVAHQPKQTSWSLITMMRTVIRTMMMMMKVVIDNDREMLKKVNLYITLSQCSRNVKRIRTLRAHITYQKQA